MNSIYRVGAAGGAGQFCCPRAPFQAFPAEVHICFKVATA